MEILWFLSAEDKKKNSSRYLKGKIQSKRIQREERKKTTLKAIILFKVSDDGDPFNYWAISFDFDNQTKALFIQWNKICPYLLYKTVSEKFWPSSNTRDEGSLEWDKQRQLI